jgi:hypothetical protein
MDVGRRLHSEWSDEVLWRMLEDAAGPPPETITRPDGTREITKTFEHPSGVWPVRTRLKAVPGSYSHALAYFRHDVERLYVVANKSKKSKLVKPAPKLAGSANSVTRKGITAGDLKKLTNWLTAEHESCGYRYLPIEPTWKKVQKLFPKITSRVYRNALDDLGFASHKSGRRTKKSAS